MAEADTERPPAASGLAVAVTLTAGLEAHRAELGPRCRGRAITAVAIAYSLVVVPTSTNPCGPAEISLKRSEGSVRARDRVALRP